jgi:hypothetical protein
VTPNNSRVQSTPGKLPWIKVGSALRAQSLAKETCAMGKFKNLLITLLESPDPDDRDLLIKLLAEKLESDDDEEGEDIADQRLPD